MAGTGSCGNCGRAFSPTSGAPITNIGLRYAYKRGSPEYAALDEDVTKWTGKRSQTMSAMGR